MTHEARRVGQRIRRIGDDERQSVGFKRLKLGNNIRIDGDVGVEQSQATRGVVAVVRAGLFIHAGGDGHQCCAF